MVPPGGCERGGDRGKIKWKSSEVIARAVSRVQNEFINKFKMAAGDKGWLWRNLVSIGVDCDRKG